MGAIALCAGAEEAALLPLAAGGRWATANRPKQEGKWRQGFSAKPLQDNLLEAALRARIWPPSSGLIAERYNAYLPRFFDIPSTILSN